MEIRRKIISAAMIFGIIAICAAQNVSYHAHNKSAETVFAELMHRTGKNFIYKSQLLRGLRLSVDAGNEPLEKVLDRMLAPHGIGFTIKGRNVTLYRKKQKKITVSGYVRSDVQGEAIVGALVKNEKSKEIVYTNASGFYTLYADPGNVSIKVMYPGYETKYADLRATSSKVCNFSLAESKDREKGEELQEVIVTADRNRTIAMETADIGRYNLTQTDIRNTPVVFSEPDVIKTLQTQPGVSAGMEGLAGMYVHGGGADENLYMLDNVPLYQVNHFGGLLSAFNVEAIKNVDFYKSSFPARYNGRLSSILEVHTKDGSMEEHHGSGRLGLTSGAFNIDGPIWKNHTTYSLALRQTWYDILTLPGLAIYNNVREDKDVQTKAAYRFTDINAKITHHFDATSRISAMFYFGMDYLQGGNITDYSKLDINDNSKRKEISTLRWGNIVGSLNWDKNIGDRVFMQLTAAYSLYNSSIRRENERYDKYGDDEAEIKRFNTTSHNKISDWTGRVDFDARLAPGNTLSFGANYTYHTFHPHEVEGSYSYRGVETSTYESYDNKAHEAAIYVGDDWKIQNVRLNVGVNGGLFSVDGKNHFNLNPRASVMWNPNPNWTFKAGYSRMTQYVHQLTESTISLPTDRWVPVCGDFRPQTSDKYSIGAYFDFQGYGVSVEAYWKEMRNVLDYRDDYYYYSDGADWWHQLCSGNGRSRGIDFMLTKTIGPVNVQASYSLLWATRKFADKNGGRQFPARFDNRHKINLTASWEINDKWSVNGAWTGMSGNMISLSTQYYIGLDDDGYYNEIDLNSGTNNYRLPFYHRLDLSAQRKTHNGYWTFSLYNAYCNMNVISIVKRYEWNNAVSKPQYTERLKFMRLIPIIPSVSYTWVF